MKRLFFLLILISFQASFANWEATSWRSGIAIYSIWAQDSVLIYYTEKYSDTFGIIKSLNISLDSGRTYPIVSPIPTDVYFENVVIVGESLFLVGPEVLWRSDNWGASWVSKTNGLPSNITISKLLAVGDKLFLGTYIGLFSSSDRGDTWQHLQNGIDSIATIVNIAKFKNSLILLRGRNEFFNSAGIYFSSDNGNNWADRSDARFVYSSFNKIVFIGDTIILGSTPGEKGQWFCFTTDEGATWNNYHNNVLSRTSGYDMKTIGPKLLLLINDGEFYASTTDWRTWSQKNEEIPRPLSVRITDLAVANNRVYASSGSELWVSYDSAETWQPIITGKNYGYIYCIADCGDAVFAGTSSFEYATTYPDAVFSTTDRGETWSPKGIKNGDIRSIISEGNIIIADGLEQSFISTDRGDNWNALPLTISLRTLAQEFAIIGETIFAIDRAKRIMKSDDFGATWIPKSSGLSEKNYGTTALYAFGNKLFAFSDRKLYVSENLGESWELYGNSFNAFGYSLDSWIAAEGSMIAVSYDSQCYLSPDNGQTWKNITAGLELEERHHVSQLAIKDGVVYLAMNEMGFFISQDSGKTLILKNDELPNKNESGDNPFAFHDNYIYLGVNYGNLGLDEMAIYRSKISDFLSAPDDKKNDRSLTVFPTPAGDFITVKGFSGADRRFTISNLLGQIVLSGDFTGDRISVASLPPGAYALRLGGQTAMALKK